jgi:hypothetical protein
MTADPAARLAEIRARHIPGAAVTLARLIDDATIDHPLPDGTRVRAVVHGCVVNDAAQLRAAVGQAWLLDLPALLDFADKALEIAARLDDTAARLRGYEIRDTTPGFRVERDDRAAGLLHTAEDIRGALAAALSEHTQPDQPATTTRRDGDCT